MGLQTGLSTAVPVYGKGAGDIVDAIGTALIWSEVSSMITAADIIISNIIGSIKTSQNAVTIPGI